MNEYLTIAACSRARRIVENAFGHPGGTMATLQAISGIIPGECRCCGTGHVCFTQLSTKEQPQL